MFGFEFIDLRHSMFADFKVTYNLMQKKTVFAQPETLSANHS